MTEPAEVRIYNLIRELRINHQLEHSSKEQEWIIKHLDDEQLQAAVAKLSIVALHVLSALEKADNQTGIDLANAISVTRGGVTRAAKKLIDFNLVTSKKRPDNKKNIYYRLTLAGRKVARVHDQMHQELQAMVIKQMDAKYSQAELTIVADFLASVLKAENEF